MLCLVHVCSLQVSTSSRNAFTLNESNALMTSDGENVAELSDEDLYERLKEFGVDVGPIVGECHFLSALVRWSGTPFLRFFLTDILSFRFNQTPIPEEASHPYSGWRCCRITIC